MTTLSNPSYYLEGKEVTPQLWTCLYYCDEESGKASCSCSIDLWLNFDPLSPSFQDYNPTTLDGFYACLIWAAELVPSAYSVPFLMGQTYMPRFNGIIKYQPSGASYVYSHVTRIYVTTMGGPYVDGVSIHYITPDGQLTTANVWTDCGPAHVHAKRLL